MILERFQRIQLPAAPGLPTVIEAAFHASHDLPARSVPPQRLAEGRERGRLRDPMADLFTDLFSDPSIAANRPKAGSTIMAPFMAGSLR